MSKLPIIFFDLETTGKAVGTDRIVQLAAIKWFPDTDTNSGLKKILVNPCFPISAEATSVHGITNEMVANKEPFARYANSLAEFFNGCIVAGYNIRDFDVPMLYEEFNRCGISIQIAAIFDSYRIYALKERRDLAAAVRFYLNTEMDNAHEAGADTLAAKGIFHEQMARYPELKAMTPEQLDVFCNNGIKTLDLAGKIYVNANGEPTYSFGSNTKDVPVKKNLKFAEWMLANPFPADTKRVLRSILNDLQNQK